MSGPTPAGRLAGRVALVAGVGRTTAVGFAREGAEHAHYLAGQVLQPHGGWVMP